jgi:gamma-glutamyl-gamma-aminobutyrate hydrolase PuuD
MKKIVGIPVPFYSFGDYPIAYEINKSYIDWLSPKYNVKLLTEADDPKETSIDILLLPGGLDIDPTLYGWDNIASSCFKERDLFDLKFYKYFKNKIPILGICRGHQLIWAYETSLKEQSYLRQHFDYCQHIYKHRQKQKRNLTSHFVNSYFIKENRLYTQKKLAVNSLHHQGIVTNSKNLELFLKLKDNLFKPLLLSNLVVGKNTRKFNLVLEAYRFNFKVPVVGVQWHPEELQTLNIDNLLSL